MKTKKILTITFIAALLGFVFFSCSRGSWFFLTRMKSEPGCVGAIAPSSKHLAIKVCKEALKNVTNSSDYVIEIGPGTGSFTRVILDSGIAPDHLICVELDPELQKYMTEHFPQVRTILGNALDLEEILLNENCGKVAAIVSGVPLANLPVNTRKDILTVYSKVISPDGCIIQFSYFSRPPKIPELDITLVGFVFFNMPRAFVWKMKQKTYG